MSNVLFGFILLALAILNLVFGVQGFQEGDFGMATFNTVVGVWCFIHATVLVFRTDRY